MSVNRAAIEKYHKTLSAAVSATAEFVADQRRLWTQVHGSLPADLADRGVLGLVKASFETGVKLGVNPSDRDAHLGATEATS